MSNFDSVEAVLDFAIDSETESRQFYLDLADKAKNKAMSQAFKEMADEEERHRNKLEAVKRGDIDFTPSVEKVRDLKIADYTVAPSPSGDLNYADALVIAMNKEKAAYRLYTKMADSVDSGELVDLFLALAQEEAKHKLRFEIEYDNEVLKED
jgi:rubrerythrin